MNNVALLLLTDSRFPAGTHAHSSGLEAAVRADQVTGIEELESFLRGRLATAGPVTAAFAAAAFLAVEAGTLCRPDADGAGTLCELDAELDARTPSPALRLVSRRQGRALVRAARATWPAPHYDRLPEGPHHPVALGVTGAAAGLTVEQTALAAAYGVVTVPAGAAVRLLGLDPYQVQHLLARLADACATVTSSAVAAAGKAPAELPAHTAPLTDISAELHATWEVRLFAS